MTRGRRRLQDLARWSCRNAVLASIAACAMRGGSTTQRPMLAVVDAYFRAAQAQDIDSVVNLFAPTALYEDVTFDFRISGRAELRGMFAGAFAAIVDRCLASVPRAGHC